MVEITRLRPRENIISQVPRRRTAHATQLLAAPGNQVMQRLLRSEGVLAKLTVNDPGDRYEQEADKAADQVMRMTEGSFQAAGNPPQIQRMCDDCEEEVQRASIGPDPLAEEEDQVQAKRVEAVATPQTGGLLEGQLHSTGGGRPLSDTTRRFFEQRFGREFASVRVHDSGQDAALAANLSARAFTWRNHIFFGAGQFAPDSTRGRRLLAHELTHVLQQGQSGSCGGPSLQRAEEETPPAPPADCDRTTALTWSDFTGSVPSSSSYAAMTYARVNAVASNTRFQAQFVGSSSWVKDRYTLADRRMFSGIPGQVTACSDLFARQEPGTTGAYYDIRYAPSGPACASSHTLAASFRATSGGDCTTYGTDADATGLRESNRLLAHEQRHYDIACAFATRANALIAGGVTFANVQTVVTNRLQPVQDLYDSESDHGCTASGQSDWDTNYRTKVDAEFSSLTPPAAPSPGPTPGPAPAP